MSNFQNCYTDIVVYHNHITYRHVTDNGQKHYADEILQCIPYIQGPHGWIPNEPAIAHAVEYWRRQIDLTQDYLDER